MKAFDGRVAAITGAASGIGRALAIELARRGCDLAIADIDTDGLEGTAARCADHRVEVTTEQLDVASRDGVLGWADHVVRDHGRVNLLVNNAGVSLGYDVESMSFEDFDWLMGINLGGVVNGTKAFLPHLRRSGDGHVVNVSSVFGLISIPHLSAYNAAKFAVRGFSDSLRMEMKASGSPVSVTTVHPGGVKTNISNNVRYDPVRLAVHKTDPGKEFEKMARTTAEAAASAILEAVRRDRRRVTIGHDAKVIDLLSRLPAPIYQTPLTVHARREYRRIRKLAPR